MSHEIGAVLLVLLLSITLADRINHDRKLRMRAHAIALAHERRSRSAQEALIKSKEEANIRLEQRVKERTIDLNKTMHQLKLANDQLQELAKTDGLTKVNNRAYFDQDFQEEYRRALRMKIPLALIILDIDFFKKINDTYGHPGGDACLRAMANLIQPKVNRAGDVLARFGGEEFVILLPDCTLDNAFKLAETLRKDVQKLIVPFEGQNIRFTASFGVSCGKPDTVFTPDDLLNSADKALYQAKRDGRNCVKSEADSKT
jgi:diguanylate cyclase